MKDSKCNSESEVSKRGKVITLHEPLRQTCSCKVLTPGADSFVISIKYPL